MNFKDIAQKGIDSIRKKNQQHQMPIISIELFGSYWKKKNAVYGINWSIDRKEHIDFIEKLSYTIDRSSKINVKCDDPFVTLNLEHELKYLKNVEINNMSYDLPAGNPEFYRRSSNASTSQTGSSLVYDEHIYNAVKRKSGKFKENGPFIIDHAWFQGEAKQGKFRRWLFDIFGLKNIIILDPKEFDVDSAKTGICMIYGEDRYNGTISLHNLINNEKFDCDFRSIGLVIPNKDLSTLLPKIKTKTDYEWKRTKVTLKLDENENVIEGPKEIKEGDIPVLKRLRLGKDPEYYYTTAEYVTDWTDSNTERFVTRYQPNTQAKDDSGNRLWYKIAVGTVVKPGTIIPGDMWFTYTVVDNGTGEHHKKHLMSEEVTKILKATRTGQSLHTPQTIWVPYATEFTGFTDNDKKIINNL
jgi:hypothetical protein